MHRRRPFLVLLAVPMLWACRPPAEPTEWVDPGSSSFKEFDKVPKAAPGEARLKKPWEPGPGLNSGALLSLERDLACLRAFYSDSPKRLEQAVPLLYVRYGTDAESVRSSRKALAEEPDKAAIARFDHREPLCKKGQPSPEFRIAAGEDKGAAMAGAVEPTAADAEAARAQKALIDAGRARADAQARATKGVPPVSFETKEPAGGDRAAPDSE